MKRCPECRRDYYDDTLLYCLDDGNALLEGPASDGLPTIKMNHPGSSPRKTPSTEDSTAVLPRSSGKYSAPQSKSRWILFATLVSVLSVSVYLSYRFLTPSTGESASPGVANTSNGVKLYWQMSATEQSHFVEERARHIEKLINVEPTNFGEDELNAIKVEIEDYLVRRDSLSQKPFEEGLRVIYGRASQYAPVVISSYESMRVKPALGLYQAMIESEYNACPSFPLPNGPVGMFQFSRGMAAKYGITPADYCDVEKQSNAAARLMSDLTSDFGEGGSNATLGLLAYMIGPETVMAYLRQSREAGISGRSYWVIFRHRQSLRPPPIVSSPPLSLQSRGFSYVPRFYAAAIIGETPGAFDLVTPPLTSSVDKAK